MRRFLDSGGTLSIGELAEAAGVPKERISKWKSEDKWEAQLKKRPKKRGGQAGNKNAKGRTPAKDGNKNAVTHGAFARISIEDIPREEVQRIMRIKEGESLTRMIEELQALLLRKAYLEGLLEKYTAPEAEKEYYVDKIVHMITPKKETPQEGEPWPQEETAGQAYDPEGGEETMETAIKTIIKGSAFDRAMKVEAELNRLHGRIIKQIDSIKSYELESRRINLEERKYNLARQKLAGVFEIDDETGEIIDDMMSDGDGGGRFFRG